MYFVGTLGGKISYSPHRLVVPELERVEYEELTLFHFERNLAFLREVRDSQHSHGIL